MANQWADPKEARPSFSNLLDQSLAQDRIRLHNAWVRLQQKHLPEHARAKQEAALARQARISAETRAARAKRKLRLEYPESLPISVVKEAILETIIHSQVLVLAGETGSGKTTQLPKMCLEAGRGIEGRIGCTQPRRVAATSIAARLAFETQTQEGREIGSKIRFSDRTRPETSVKVMTDGILLSELQADPFLWEYDTLIVDEAHERSLNIDFILGHIRQLLPLRKDLKLIITSATIDTKLFSKAFGNAPIIEVSGKLFPVETIYRPLRAQTDGDGTEETDYIQASVDVVHTICTDPSNDGDVLVFMPAEKDIREARDLLEGRRFASTRIIPLFGRLSAQEQQEVFRIGPERKIVIATNIAETSLTIPGIRWVVDTGLARISRYSPRSRTRRLPIEPISRSSADQRKGRCGRVSDGVCIRLFSEEDYQERPEHTQPEIQRCNLAEVILRMKAFNLGEIEEFPFLNPPHPQAIRSGYQLLTELGALDKDRAITDLGRELARLPLDPTIGRMILQSRKEKASREVSVIAAGLSIQDPRERPMDQRASADAMHKQFVDPDSDFMTLLNIWNAYHDQWENFKTQNQMRRFCKTHFLSYLRMREWIDVQNQIHECLKELGGFDSPNENAGYEAIHRSILSGLLAYTGFFDQTNRYKISGNRIVEVFPASTLYRKIPRIKPGQKKPPSDDAGKHAKQPNWMVSGEIMETSRLFARTLAGIQPAWIAEIGRHLCKTQYDTPIWNPRLQRVTVKETVRLYGMVLKENTVDAGKIFPEKSTEIFIREALIPFDVKGPWPFLDHNKKMFEEVESLRTRSRDSRFFDIEERLYLYYARHLKRISSVHDLNRAAAIEIPSNPDFLKIQKSDLVDLSTFDLDQGKFPDRIELPEGNVEIQYAYAPGQEHDGVTFRMPLAMVRHVPESTLKWSIPGMREEITFGLLKSLPKSLRRELAPIPEKVREIVDHLDPGSISLEAAMADWILQTYGIRIPTDAWKSNLLPAHLQWRYEIIGADHQPLAAGRSLNEILGQLDREQQNKQLSIHRAFADRWERYDITRWDWEDLPEFVECPTDAGLPWIAWPGLQEEDGRVHLRLFSSAKEASASSPAGWKRLAQLVLHKELAWCQKDLMKLGELAPLYVSIGSPDQLPARVHQLIVQDLFKLTPVHPMTKKRFQDQIRSASQALSGLPFKMLDLLRETFQLRQELLLMRTPFPDLKNNVNRLFPKDFPDGISWSRLHQYPRILKALRIRFERAKVNPSKDKEKLDRLKPFLEALEKASQYNIRHPELQPHLEHVQECVEELKISIFAQEIGTRFPISEKIMIDKFEQFRSKRLSLEGG